MKKSIKFQLVGNGMANRNYQTFPYEKTLL